MLESRRQERWVLYLAFILSGAAGLVYEVVWAGLLGQLVGGTTATHTVVLAAFMGGLALGNRYGGRWADSGVSPLRLYGYLEAAVGLLGVLSPQIAELSSLIYLGLAPDLDGPFVMLDLPLRLGLAALCILPGAVAMGGTLPVLVRASTAHLQDLGRSVGWLYFINSAGAMAGAFLAGFVLLPAFGHTLSLITAGSTNLLLALVALGLSQREDPTPSEPRPDAAARTYSAAQVRAALQAIFISGIATMIVEVVWTRLLTLTLGGSAHAFSIMLGTFIGGIAVGGVIASRVGGGDRDAFRPLLVAQAVAALSLIVALPFYDRLPWIFWSAARALRPSEDTYSLYLGLSTAVAVLAMCIPTLAMGATLPLASRVATPSLGQAGRKVGGVFSINTLGNVIGAAAGGLLLVPIVGIETTLRIAVGVLCVAALRLLWTTLPTPRRAPVVAAATAAALLALALLPGWHPGLLHSGLYRYTDTDFGTLDEFLADVDDVEFLYARDDAEASVSVVRDPEGHLFMRVNGKTDASSYGDVPTQLLLGAAPLLFHPNPRRVLVVGLGSGISVAPVVADPRVERIDVVEISPAVVEASRLFDGVSGAPLDDPRVHLYETDGRTVLRRPPGGGTWDVIISQPSNPWLAGSAALFTVEYFRLARERLSEGGVMGAWFQGYEIDDATLETLLRSYGEVFPRPRFFNPRGNDFVVIAGADGAPANLGLAEQVLRMPAMREVLSGVLPGSVPLDLHWLLALEVLDPATFRGRFAQNDDIPLHRDRHPMLQYQGPRGVFVGERATLLDQLDQRREPLADSGLLLARLRGATPFTSAEQRALLQLFLRRDRPLDRRLARSLALTLWLAQPGDPEALLALSRTGDLELIGTATLWDRRHAGGGPTTPEACEAWTAFERRLVRLATSAFTQPAKRRLATARDACADRFAGSSPP